MSITGGKVTFGRTVQPAQYESKKAEVEIAFAVEDGASDDAVTALVDKAAHMARGKALELVGMTAEAKPAATRASKPATEAKADITKTTTAKETKPAGKSKAELEAELAAKLNAKGDELPGTEAKPQISTGGERKDPAQKSADPDGLEDVLDLKEGQVKEFTDADLTDVVSRVNGVIKDPQKIKAVRAKYTTGAIATIGKEHRAKFVADIEALLPKK